jgi:hypothetical protein
VKVISYADPGKYTHRKFAKQFENIRNVVLGAVQTFAFGASRWLESGSRSRRALSLLLGDRMVWCLGVRQIIIMKGAVGIICAQEMRRGLVNPYNIQELVAMQCKCVNDENDDDDDDSLRKAGSWSILSTSNPSANCIKPKHTIPNYHNLAQDKRYEQTDSDIDLPCCRRTRLRCAWRLVGAQAHRMRAMRPEMVG